MHATMFSIGIALGLSALCASGHPLDTWHVRQTNSNAYHALFGVTYGGGLFVAVGGSGVILTSATGENWALQNSGTGAVLRDVAYGTGTFVVVGDEGIILASTDGTNWASTVSGRTSSLVSIAYQSGVFVVTSMAGELLASADGNAWSPQVPGDRLSRPWFIAAGNGMFLLESNAGTNLLSADGTNWFPRPSGSDTELYTAGYGMGMFISIDIGLRTFTSTDGSNWVARGILPFIRPTQIAYGNGHFVVGGVLAYRRPETDWTVSPGAFARGNDVAFGNGTFVAVGIFETIQQSDPVAWLETVEPGGIAIFGMPGSQCSVEARETLSPGSAWMALTNFTLTLNPFPWTDPDRSNHPARLYRARMER